MKIPDFNSLKLLPEILDNRRDQVLLMPADLFFIEIIEIPEETDSNEYDNFIEISLESLSPFSLDKLSWGYLLDEENNRIVLYAAVTKRLENEGYKDLNQFKYVFPSFLVFCNQSFAKHTVLYIKEKTSISGLAFLPHNPLPLAVITQSHDNGIAVDNAVQEIKSQLLSIHQTISFHHEEAIRTVESIQTQENEVIILHGNGINKKEAVSSYSIKSNKTLWNADIRSDQFAIDQQRLRNKERYLWHTVVGSAIAAMLLLICHILTIANATRLVNKEYFVEELSTEANEIETRDNLLAKLEMLTTGTMEPFIVLNTLNKYRPKTIYFQTIAALSIKAFLINGIAQNAQQVNDYTKKLEASKKFKKIELKDIRSRGGDIFFSLSFEMNMPDKVPDPTTVSYNE